MPLLFLLGVWGVCHRLPAPARRPGAMTRAPPGGDGRRYTPGVLLFGYIADRYLADFLPFVALAGVVGLVDVWRRLDGRGRWTRLAPWSPSSPWSALWEANFRSYSLSLRHLINIPTAIRVLPNAG